MPQIPSRLIPLRFRPLFLSFSFWLTLILLIAAASRFIFLGNLPPLLLQDEANLGFNAISIAQTGKDEWGNFLPLTFFSFGDNKPPVYVYLTSLVYMVSGWSPVLPRIPSAVAGVVSVLFTALWIRKSLKHDLSALLAALVLAVSPWGIHLSRMALEANVALCFLLGGLTAFSYAQESKKHWKTFIALSAISFALSSYTYIAYRLVVALVLLVSTAGELWLSRPKNLTKNWKSWMTTKSVFLLILTGILMLPSAFLSGNLTRYNQSAFVTSENLQANLTHYHNDCHLLSGDLHLPPLRLICKVVWNEQTLSPLLIEENFVQHILPNFLFLNGDPVFNRNPAKTGMFYWYLAPFFAIGLGLALQKYRNNLLVLFGWLLAVVPSMLTGTPHLIRMSVQLPFVVFLIALGLRWASEKKPGILRLLLPGALLLSFGLFSLKYSLSVFSNSQEYNGFVQPIAQDAHTAWKEGSIVYIDPDIAPEMHTYLAFWNNMDPDEYQSLVDATATDTGGFTRPTQLGERLIFKNEHSSQTFCNQEGENVVLFTKLPSLPFPPSKIYSEKTGIHHFAYKYDLEEMKQQTKQFQEFCAE